jgi:Lon protease-like protein
MTLPSELPIFPLNVVLFPGMPLPLHIFEERYKSMINRCIQAGHAFGVVLIREGQEVGPPARPHDVGTTAVIAVERPAEDA